MRRGSWWAPRERTDIRGEVDALLKSLDQLQCWTRALEPVHAHPHLSRSPRRSVARHSVKLSNSEPQPLSRIAVRLELAKGPNWLHPSRSAISWSPSPSTPAHSRRSLQSTTSGDAVWISGLTELGSSCEQPRSRTVPYPAPASAAERPSRDHRARAPRSNRPDPGCSTQPTSLPRREPYAAGSA
jgi:hypothetical protein